MKYWDKNIPFENLGTNYVVILYVKWKSTDLKNDVTYAFGMNRA